MQPFSANASCCSRRKVRSWKRTSWSAACLQTWCRCTINRCRAWCGQCRQWWPIANEPIRWSRECSCKRKTKSLSSRWKIYQSATWLARSSQIFRLALAAEKYRQRRSLPLTSKLNWLTKGFSSLYKTKGQMTLSFRGETSKIVWNKGLPSLKCL